MTSAVALDYRTPLRSNRSSTITRPGGPGTFALFAAQRSRGSLTGGHAKVMLAYGHSLFLDHQGFGPFSTDHREATGLVGPAVARVEIHCKLQTVTSCALTTASTAVMEVMD